jgi:hypothetical protein
MMRYDQGGDLVTAWVAFVRSVCADMDRLTGDSSIVHARMLSGLVSIALPVGGSRLVARQHPFVRDSQAVTACPTPANGLHGLFE